MNVHALRVESYIDWAGQWTIAVDFQASSCLTTAATVPNAKDMTTIARYVNAIVKALEKGGNMRLLPMAVQKIKTDVFLLINLKPS